MKTRPRVWLLALVLALAALPAFGASTWHGVVNGMEALLDRALVLAPDDPAGARDLVNEAYYAFYEKEGMERAVLSNISGKRASLVEYQFSTVKKVILARRPAQEVSKEVGTLITQLREDATRLDGREWNAFTAFLGSFLLLAREGAEAILIIGAILAFLVRSGNRRFNGAIYLSSAVAVAASLLTAWLLQGAFQVSGAGREVLEGGTVLAAAVVLFFTSHWMISKAESGLWQAYVDGKVRASVSRGSSLVLGLTCFLAVYREGAETVLFYQALFLEGGKHVGMIWVGMAAGALFLAVLFLIVRFASVKVPLKPFFWATGLLMYLMAFVFAGSGVKELQEAEWISVTPIPGLAGVDLLGIYPTWETVAPQLVLIAAALGAIPFHLRRIRST